MCIGTKNYGPLMFRNRYINRNKAKNCKKMNFKMAAEDDLDKNVTNSYFVPQGIRNVKSLGVTSIANFARTSKNLT